MRQITFTGLSKSYGRHSALSGVDLKLVSGRAHALMGENGAGKSTLIKLVAGVASADAMQVQIDAAPILLNTPAHAYQAGFRFIHQELNTVPQLTVAENIMLGKDYPKRWGFAVDWKALEQRAGAALQELGISHIDTRAQAGSLSSGERTLISIAAALVSDHDNQAILYVLDEPTAALTGAEAQMLFQVIEKLKAGGAAVLYVSHRMDEVMHLCDDVSVLRDGRLVFDATMATTGQSEIIKAMTGREVSSAYPHRTTPIGNDVCCQFMNVDTAKLCDVSFDLRCGEILGVCGLAESGQSELLRVFLGLEPVIQGECRLNNKSAPDSPNSAWSAGVAYVPRERRNDALMPGRSVSDNTVLSHLALFGWFASAGREKSMAQELGAAVRLKARSMKQSVGELSGGNQQKVVFGRALGRSPQLLLLDEPTRGVDVGAKFDIYSLVRKLSDEGCSVIMSCSDLPELLGMCDRLLVMKDGSLLEIVNTAGLTPASLLETFYAHDSVH